MTGSAPPAAAEFVRRRSPGARRAFLAQPDGPQAAVLELGGWDNPCEPGQSERRVRRCSCASSTPALPRCATGWSRRTSGKRTVIVVATEFGREVAVNGTLGTDHGTGGAAFVLGGAVRGGRVIADWPGLAKGRPLRGP
jgi:uncharacterized protein (DUF1501 family)